MATHLTPAAFTFLRGLTRHNDRPWFDERKATYERELKAPMLALAAELDAGLARFAPDYTRPAHKAVMRIYRDIRFSKDKRPYKTHLAAWWSRHGLEKTSGGGFYLQISPTEVLVAAGVYMPERDQLLALRRYLLDHHAAYEKLVASRRITALYQPFDGLKLTRAPKGFPNDNPATPLISQRQWGIHAQLPPDLALTPQLLPTILKHFQAATPLVDLLNTPLIPTTTRKPMF